MGRDWLALAIGNSRLHWGWFDGDRPREFFYTPHLSEPLSIARLRSILPFTLDYSGIPLVIASVVPPQTELCLACPESRTLALKDVPLEGLYPTLGIDRALVALATGDKYGFPCLAIDAGTALTFTAIDGERRFAGGAILPGIGLQSRSLAGGTAALPAIALPEELPPLWGKDTAGAIASGILHATIAAIDRFTRDWRELYPTGAIAITGGDALRISRFLTTLGKTGAIVRDDTLLFRGIAIAVGAI
jgi:type III pantothenate kinase